MKKKIMQENLERIAFKNYCGEFKLKPEWLDKTFEDRGKKYTIIGLNLRSMKFPVLTDGGVRFNADYVRGLITGDMVSIEKEREKQRGMQYQQAREDYTRYCLSYDLEKTWLDKTFVDRGRTYRIDG